MPPKQERLRPPDASTGNSSASSTGQIRPATASTSRSPPFPGTPSRTLLLTMRDEDELVGVDVLLTGAAAVGPAAQDGLQQQHRLRQCQAGRRAGGHRRSRVRKAWAQVTSAVWWWKP